MRYRYRGNKRRTRRGALLILLLLTAVFLVSCVAGTNPLWIRNLFGIHTENYSAEPTERVLDADGEPAATLCDTVDILLAGSIHLTPFQNTSQAVKYYRDEILNDMLRDNYTLYNGNSQLLATAESAYPNTVLSTLIPEEDFENTVFRYFGDTGIKHADGEVFTYLSRADAYTAPLQARKSGVEIQVESIEETSNTYRMYFTLADTDRVSDLYTSVFVKRDGGTCYLYSLK